ncbi:MAG: hypothetical protein MJ032_03275 [Acidaminococcaceae bacterium]|nr:hypothetical protein [Acidaminococcaceae bacterium]
MSDENLIALVMATVRNNVPDNAQMFNLSVDFIKSAPEMVTAAAKIVHKGRKTMELDVEVKDMEDNLLVKAMATLLMGK